MTTRTTTVLAKTVLAAALAALLTAAIPARAQSEPPTSADATRAEWSDWMREQATQLAGGFEALKDRLAALGRDAGPALDRAREGLDAAHQRLDAEMPQVRETTSEWVERLQSVAARIGSSLQEAMERLRQRFQKDEADRPKELRA